MYDVARYSSYRCIVLNSDRYPSLISWFDEERISVNIKANKVACVNTRKVLLPTRRQLQGNSYARLGGRTLLLT